jgi:hypothetical protein
MKRQAGSAEEMTLRDKPDRQETMLGPYDGQIGRRIYDKE